MKDSALSVAQIGKQKDWSIHSISIILDIQMRSNSKDQREDIS